MTQHLVTIVVRDGQSISPFLSSKLVFYVAECMCGAAYGSQFKSHADWWAQNHEFPPYDKD